ncbi:MAG: hypothetical protein K2L07_13845 [Lachnospiraceae bacterium]|nr:hypothetical protein [Lachnospiraceae bacterium]
MNMPAKAGISFYYGNPKDRFEKVWQIGKFLYTVVLRDSERKVKNELGIVV